MPTQKQISDHLDMSQQAVAELLGKLGIEWRAASLDTIRIAYIRHLRGQASGHKSDDGMDLIKERVLSERVDRELKELMVAEKRGLLINVSQLEPELMNMIGAFRAELLSRDDKLASDLATLYGIQVDVTILNEFTNAALEQFCRYDPGSRGFVDAAAGGLETAGALEHDGVVT
jgi:hypothetical protein